MSEPFIGVIGGSGLYAIEGFHAEEEAFVDTPFGATSDNIVVGELEGARIAFLPRHGRGHRFSPSEIPYRANIYALKKLGVDRVVSISAVGSMKESLSPGSLVTVDQFIDRTVGRARTFFTDGCVAHVSMADPICPMLSAAMADAADAEGINVQRGGTYVCIEGPQFSTRAESQLFRTWGVDVIGMTGLPEARLAREAQLPYATLALVTDYDCWHQGEADVSVEAVLAALGTATVKAKRVIAALARHTADSRYALDHSPAHDALKNAVMTAWDQIPASTRSRLALLLDR